jgi:hypothetical protein
VDRAQGVTPLSKERTSTVNATGLSGTRIRPYDGHWVSAIFLVHPKNSDSLLLVRFINFLSISMKAVPTKIGKSFHKNIGHLGPFTLGKNISQNHCAYHISHVTAYDFPSPARETFCSIRSITKQTSTILTFMFSRLLFVTRV